MWIRNSIETWIWTIAFVMKQHPYSLNCIILRKYKYCENRILFQIYSSNDVITQWISLIYMFNGKYCNWRVTFKRVVYEVSASIVFTSFQKLFGSPYSIRPPQIQFNLRMLYFFFHFTSSPQVRQTHNSVPIPIFSYLFMPKCSVKKKKFVLKSPFTNMMQDISKF